MKRSIKLGSGEVVQVGDVVGFKRGFEQVGTLKNVIGPWVLLKVYDSDTGDHFVIQEPASRCWAEG